MSATLTPAPEQSSAPRPPDHRELYRRGLLAAFNAPLRLHGIDTVAEARETTVHQVWPPGALARLASAPPRVPPPRRRY